MSSRSWNRVELIGNLTRDPELRFTPSGAAVATFSIATNRTYVSEGERKEEADYHRCVAWNKLAELCQQLLKKGTKVFVSGRLQYREWEGQDGQKRRTTEIVASEVIFLGSPGARSESIDVPEDLGINEQKPETETDTETEKEKGTKEKPTTKTKTEEAPVVEGEDIPF